MQEMADIKGGDIKPEDGKIFAYVYTSEGDTFETQRKAFDMFTGRVHDAILYLFIY